MTFVHTERWEAREPTRPPWVHSVLLPPSAKRLGWILRHFFAVVGSLLIHVLLLYFLLNKMLGSGGSEVRPATKGRNLLVFDITNAPVTAPESLPSAEATQHKAAQTESSAIEAPLSPPASPEWKIVKLARADRAARVGVSPPGSSATTTPTSNLTIQEATGIQGGGGHYDPYAGATPQKLVQQQRQADSLLTFTASRQPIATLDPLIVDQAVLRAIRSMVGRNFSASEPLVMTVRVSPNGTLLDLKVDGATSDLLAALRKLLLKRQLFHIRAPMTHDQTREIEISTK